jgi:hypothetical protein
MKKALNYPELWQQKRNELPVDGDPNAGWLEMQAILDSAMPVTAVIKKPYNPKGLKGLYKLLIGISTAVVIYGAVQLYLSRKQSSQRIAPTLSAPAPIVKDSAAVIPSQGRLSRPGSVIDDRSIKDPGHSRRIAKSQPKKTDSLQKAAVPNADNLIVHRDSALIPVNPGVLRQDSSLKTLPAGLNIKSNPNGTPGNTKPTKKKRRKFQIGV